MSVVPKYPGVNPVGLPVPPSSPHAPAKSTPPEEPNASPDADKLLWIVYGQSPESHHDATSRIGGVWIPASLSSLKSLAARVLVAEFVFRHGLDRKEPRKDGRPRLAVTWRELMTATGLTRRQLIMALGRLKALKLITVSRFRWDYRDLRLYAVDATFAGKLSTCEQLGVRIPRTLFFIKDLPVRLLLAQLIYWAKIAVDKRRIRLHGTWGIVKSMPVMAKTTGLSLKQVKRGLRLLKAMGVVHTGTVRLKGLPVTRYSIDDDELANLMVDAAWELDEGRP
jgi:hypothetical protein